MRSLSPHIIPTLAVLALFLSSLTMEANGPQVLLLDGKVRTKNISFEGVRLVVERNGITVQVVTENLKRFQLELDLQQVYVLTFHREACLSKALHIDTHVPEEALEAAPFRFPLIVTLEPRPKGPVVRYAEPVGDIYFMDGKADFGYGTDYSLARDRQRAATGRDPRAALRPQGTGPVPSDVPARSSPVAGPVAPASSGTNLQSETGSRTLSRIKGASPAVEKKPRPRQEEVIQEPLYGSMPDGRTEELLIQPTYLAKEIRITEGGRTRIFRKVTHRFGEVHYFCNGRGCSETSFVSGTRRSTTPAP